MKSYESQKIPYPLASSVRETLANLTPEKNSTLFEGIDVERIRDMLIVYGTGMNELMRTIRGLGVEKPAETESTTAHIWKMFTFLLDEAQNLNKMQTNPSIYDEPLNAKPGDKRDKEHQAEEDVGFGEMACSKVEAEFLADMKAMVTLHDQQLGVLHKKERETLGALLSLKDEIQVGQTVHQKYEIGRNDMQLVLEAQSLKLDELQAAVSSLRELADRERVRCESLSERVRMKREDIFTMLLRINRAKQEYLNKTETIKEKTLESSNLTDKLDRISMAADRELNEAARLEKKIEYQEGVLANYEVISGNLPGKLKSEQEVNLQVREMLRNVTDERAKADALLEQKTEIWKHVEHEIEELKVRIAEIGENQEVIDIETVNHNRTLESLKEKQKGIYSVRNDKSKVIDAANAEFDAKIDIMHTNKKILEKVTKSVDHKTLTLLELNQQTEHIRNTYIGYERQLDAMGLETKYSSQQQAELQALLTRKQEKKAKVELELQTVSNDVNARLSDQRKMTAEVQTQLDELNATQKKVTEEHAALEEKLDKLRQHAAALDGTIEKSEAKAQMLANDTLPVAKKQREEAEHAVKKAQARLAEVEEETRELSNHMKELREMVTRQEEQRAYFQGLLVAKESELRLEEEEMAAHAIEYRQEQDEYARKLRTAKSAQLHAKAHVAVALQTLETELAVIIAKKRALIQDHEAFTATHATKTEKLQNDLEPLVRDRKAAQAAKQKAQIAMEETIARTQATQERIVQLKTALSTSQKELTTMKNRQRVVGERESMYGQPLGSSDGQGGVSRWLDRTLETEWRNALDQRTEMRRQAAFLEERLRQLKPASNTMVETGSQVEDDDRRTENAVQTDSWLMWDMRKDRSLAVKAAEEMRDQKILAQNALQQQALREL